MEIRKAALYFIAAVLVGNLFMGTTYAGDNEVITNETIIKMVKAKLGEDIIITKIKKSKTEFDTSTDNLINLKQAGVSDTIITAMQNPQTTSSEISQKGAT